MARSIGIEDPKRAGRSGWAKDAERGIRCPNVRFAWLLKCAVGSIPEEDDVIDIARGAWGGCGGCITRDAGGRDCLTELARGPVGGARKVDCKRGADGVGTHVGVEIVRTSLAAGRSGWTNARLRSDKIAAPHCSKTDVISAWAFDRF